MRTYLYLSTAVAGVIMATGNALGQCVVTQDCAAMGYTKSSCPDGNGVKCPFGNKWFCVDLCGSGYKYTCSGTGYAGGVGSACGGKYTSCTCASKYNWNGSACTACGSSYKYTCTGTGYAGGSGTACGGYYTKCNCKSPYTWSSGTCKCDSSYAYACTGTGYSGGVGTACGGKYAACTCASGYEWKDGSCQKQTQNGAVGELYYCNGKVVGVRATGMGFYVALRDLGQMNWSSANSQCQSYAFCGNVKGTLPTREQLLLIYQNKSRVNSLLSTNGGTQLTNSWYWSSTDGDYTNYYYIVHMSGGGYTWDYMYNLYYVRPVLASY